MFGGIDFLPTFAPAIRKKHGANERGGTPQRLVQKVFSRIVKKFLKKVAKNLEVTKTCLTFAIRFAPKFIRANTEQGSLTYWYN